MATTRSKRRGNGKSSNAGVLPGVGDLMRTIEANFKALAAMMPGAAAKPRRRKRAASVAGKAKRAIKRTTKKIAKKTAKRRASTRRAFARRASRRRDDMRPSATMPI